MKQVENILLDTRNKKVEALDRTTPITIVFSGILGFLVVVISYSFILLDLRERNKITNELKKINY